MNKKLYPLPLVKYYPHSDGRGKRDLNELWEYLKHKAIEERQKKNEEIKQYWDAYDDKVRQKQEEMEKLSKATSELLRKEQEARAKKEMEEYQQRMQQEFDRELEQKHSLYLSEETKRKNQAWADTLKGLFKE